jgi:hypothetical protein
VRRAGEDRAEDHHRRLPGEEQLAAAERLVAEDPEHASRRL